MTETHSGNRALQSLHRAVTEAGSYVTLKEGDLLVIENRQAVHARMANTWLPHYQCPVQYLGRTLIATILIVEPVSSGNKLVVCAEQRGWNVLVASHNADDRTLTTETKRLASTIVEVDTNDVLSTIEAVSKVLVLGELDGVVAGSELHVEIAAEIAQKLGLPGLESKNVAFVRNKAKMRKVLEQNNVRSPRYREVTCHAQAVQASKQLTFPVVVKPTDASGSIHVVKAYTAEEAVLAYDAIDSDNSYDLGRQMGNEAIIEEYVSGEEYSADGYVWDGSVCVLAVTRKLLGTEPNFVELGHVTPAPLNSETLDIIDQYVCQVISAVSLNNSVFHCEIRMTNEGPTLMEIAARLPGDQIVDLVEGATGVSLADVALEIATGKDPRSHNAKNSARSAVGIRFVDSNGLPEYAWISGWDSVESYADVLDKKLLIMPGSEVPQSYDCRRRVAYVKYRASSSEAAMAVNERLGQELYPVKGSAS